MDRSKNEIFRKKALKQLSSPERLDSLMQVTTARGWVALVGLGAVVLAGVFWGFAGRLPDQIPGEGILLREGGLFDVQVRGGGVVDDIPVSVGDSVAQGQVVATLVAPDLEQQVETARARVGELESHLARVRGTVERTSSLNRQGAQAEIRSLEGEIDALEERTAFLETREQAHAQALQQDLITVEQYESVVSALASARDELTATRADLDRARARLVEVSSDAENRIFELESQLTAARRDLATLETRYEETTEVRTRYAGRVVEVMGDAGQMISAGTALLTIELTSEPLEAVMFVPGQGRRIEPAMRVRISPEGVSWERWGFLEGKVVRVSDVPLNRAGMMRVLQDETLVEAFTARGGAYKVDVALARDSAGALSWTTGRQPTTPVGSGMMVTGQVVVDQLPPVALIMPAIRRWVGGG